MGRSQPGNEFVAKGCTQDFEQQRSVPIVKRILLTGASGYVGGRLLPRLEERGFHVRCLARKPEFLARRVSERTEVIEGDVLCEESLGRAFEDVDTAFYMIHSMSSSRSEEFEEQDLLAAQNF